MTTVKFLSQPELRELSIATMRATFRDGASRLDALFAEMAAWEKVPSNLDINSSAWIEAEGAIGTAAKAGDLQATSDLCVDYLNRVDKFCAFYRSKYAGKGKGVRG